MKPLGFTPRVTVSVRPTTNVNVNNPPSTPDGWVGLSGDFWWLTQQTDPSENGVWIKSRVPDPDHPAGYLTRVMNLDEIKPEIRVLYGTTNGGKVFHYDPAAGYVPYTEVPDAWRDGKTADLGDFYVDSDGMVELVAGKPEFNYRKAFERFMGSGLDTLTLGREKRYGFDRALELTRPVNILGNSTLNVHNNTELRFLESHGLHMRFADSGPGVQGGWSHIKGLTLRYMGSYSESSAFHGINAEAPCTGELITTQDFPGHGLHSVADVNSTPKTGANLLRFSSCRFFQSGLSGIYLAGGDANASVYWGMDTTACGKRNFGAVKAQFVLRASNSTAIDRVITPRKSVIRDKRWKLYFLAITGGVVPANGTLDIVVEAYDRSLETQLAAAGKDTLGSGTQFGWGTEYNLPLANMITELVWSQDNLTGLTFTNPAPRSQVAVHGDHHGIFDDAFLGNSFYGCHSTAPGGRHYYAVKGGGTVFGGCYCEIGNFGEVKAPNTVAGGGLWGDPPGMQSNGVLRDTSGYKISPTYQLTQGLHDVNLRTCRQGSDEVFHVCCDDDPLGLKFERIAGGRGAGNWGFTRNGKQGLSFAGPNDQRGNTGTPIAMDGVILGNPGIRVSSGATRPAQSFELPPGQAGPENVWNVGDIFWITAPPTGAAWMLFLRLKVADPTSLIPGSSPPVYTRFNLDWRTALVAP